MTRIAEYGIDIMQGLVTTKELCFTTAGVIKACSHGASCVVNVDAAATGIVFFKGNHT
jgi:hypothetical protein